MNNDVQYNFHKWNFEGYDDIRLTITSSNNHKKNFIIDKDNIKIYNISEP